MPASEPSGRSAPERSSPRPAGALRAPACSGELTSRFRPLFAVGRGGMGSIEVAVETTEAGVERVVALKRMLPSAVADKRLEEMFLREAKLASMLEHPNVVHATSFGQRDGELYLVMEYIEGEPLSRVVALAHERGSPLALPLVAHLLAEICEGIHAAHELTDESGRPLNVVHRDVSPQNVMISYDGQAKLLDFGVAKIEALEADGKTKTGEVKGKTAYMSPEQALGDPIDRRSDLYSLGAVLFEAVSGRKMWGGGTDLDVLRRMALEEPPSLEAAAPGTPDAICRLQRRLVARDPSMRPASARDVARELRAFIASTGTSPDARVVRALMTGLFTGEIERRRAALSRAVDQLPPSTGDAAASPSAVPASDMTPVPATRGLGSSGSWPRTKRTLATALPAAVAAAIVLGWIARAATRDRVAAPTTEARTSQASAGSPAAAPPVASVAPASTSTSTPTTAASEAPAAPQPRAPPREAKAATTRPASSGSRPGPANPPPSSPGEKPHAASPPRPAGPLDVDPAPF